jgi:hypothetical protein
MVSSAPTPAPVNPVIQMLLSLLGGVNYTLPGGVVIDLGPLVSQLETDLTTEGTISLADVPNLANAAANSADKAFPGARPEIDLAVALAIAAENYVNEKKAQTAAKPAAPAAAATSKS